MDNAVQKMCILFSRNQVQRLTVRFKKVRTKELCIHGVLIYVVDIYNTLHFFTTCEV